eukprot:2020171-Prymnesium_polylepis.1
MGRGRPKGKKDSKPRADGRWDGKRADAPPRANSRAEPQQSSRKQPTLAASFARGRGQSSAGAGASSGGGSQRSKTKSPC